MRRTMVRAITVGVLGAAVLAATAPAKPAADDVSIDVHFHTSTGNVTNSPNFQVEVEIESTTGVEQTIVVRTSLASGLAWGKDAPDPTENCVTANPAVCTTKLSANEVGTFGAGWYWDVVAERPGAYEITATVEPTDVDPDLSNNSETFRVEVAQPSGSGGSGGGGSGGGAGSGGGGAVTASAAKVSPSLPKAGSTVVASVRVTRGGSPVRPTGVTCAASLGSTKVRGSATSASGVASCLYKTQKSAKGKTLTGSVSFRAGGSSFTKRFTTRLR